MGVDDLFDLEFPSDLDAAVNLFVEVGVVTSYQLDLSMSHRSDVDGNFLQSSENYSCSAFDADTVVLHLVIVDIFD